MEGDAPSVRGSGEGHEDVLQVRVDRGDLGRVSVDTQRLVRWILVDQEGRAFVPCAIGAPPGKRWHLAAETDGRSIIRVEGKRYPVTLTRVADPALFGSLVSVVEDKYPPPPGAGDAESWFFSIA